MKMIEYIQEIENINPELLSILTSILVGLLIGVEREWSEIEAGVRTFAFISLSGTLLYISDFKYAISVGLLFVILISFLMSLKAMIKDNRGIRLTTSVSMTITFTLGVLIGMEKYLIAVSTGIIVSLLLVQKNSLHSFVEELREEEIKSAVKLGILSFVIYPLLPEEPVLRETLDLQLVWLLIISISGLGFLNYILLKKYKRKGLLATSFFGGLVNSTATFIEATNRYKNKTIGERDLITSSLITNISMTLRNIVLIVVFIPLTGFYISSPILSISIMALILVFLINYFDFNLSSYNKEQEMGLDIGSPFSIKQAGLFGAIFAVIVIATSILSSFYGESSIIIAMLIAGIVSSGSAIMTIILLFTSQEISIQTALLGSLAATISSIAIKLVLVLVNDKKAFIKILLWNLPLIILSLIFTYALITLPILEYMGY